MLELKDKLGRELSLGDYVAYRQYKYFEIGRIVKITAKRMTVRITHPTYRHESYQVPNTVLKIPEDGVLTTWIMRGCP